MERCYCSCEFDKHLPIVSHCINKENCRCKGYRTIDEAVTEGLATIPPSPLGFEDILKEVQEHEQL